ncbi:MAG: YicC/YloC family endoribonuclease [Waddliaceae bacterium]
MLKSMTAYGRAVTNTSVGTLTVEIQSLNRKYLDIMITLPKALSSFETSIRKQVASMIKRGKVSVSIIARFEQKTPLSLSPNFPLAREIKDAWDTIADELNLTIDKQFYLEMLAKEPEILVCSPALEEEDGYRDALTLAVDEGLTHLMAMKVKEGKAIQDDFTPRLEQLRLWIDKIKEKSKDNAEKYYEKLKQRIESILPGHMENEERVMREICLYAEKMDISEEITRLYSHLRQFAQRLQTAREAVGKTLDFLLQEMLREIHTVGVKAANLDISNLVLEIKSELEKIKEQVQNIE